MKFKGIGQEAQFAGGVDPEIRVIARTLALAYTSLVPQAQKDKISKMFPALAPLGAPMKGQNAKSSTIALDIGAEYAKGKLNPIYERGSELVTGHDFRGRPLPWSPDQGSPTKPKYGWAEYASSIGPIPLQGPIKYVYDQIRGSGTSALDTNQIVKGLIISGLTVPGAMHVAPDAALTPKTSGAPVNMNALLRQNQGTMRPPRIRRTPNPYAPP
jgi:hypothetical protein